MSSRYPIPQTTILAEYDITAQTLRNWRLGQRRLTYIYPPKLIRKTDWDFIGRTIVYTESGKKKIAAKAAKREAPK